MLRLPTYRMARSKKKQQTPTTPQPKGHDFGGPGLSVVVNSPEFVSALSSANVIGCMYGLTRCEALQGHVIPFITLGGTSQEPLERAFSEFQRWTEEAGTEALGLTIVYLDDGGYLVCIGPRMEALGRRFTAAGTVYQPMFMAQMWIKHFETRSEGLEKFRSYRSSGLITPYVLSGCVIPDPRPDALTVASIQSHIRPLPSALDLVLFRCRIVDEPDADENFARLISAHRRARERRNSNKNTLAVEDRFGRPEAPPPPPHDRNRHRSAVLNRHFPVTLERIRSLGRYQSLLSKVADQTDIRAWQWEQAVCNLVLSASICDSAFFYPTLPQKTLQKSIGDALHTRLEEADGRDPLDGRLDETVLRTQIILDAIALLNDNGVQVRHPTLALVQTLLGRHALLEGSRE